MRLSSEEIIKLEDFLLGLGIFNKDIVSVFVEGSYLYVNEPNDIDLVVIIKDGTKCSRSKENTLVLRGLHCDVNILTVDEFNHIDMHWQFQLYHEEEDWICVYGDPNGVKRRVLDDRLLALEESAFDAILFHPESDDYKPKRLVTLFVLARKLGHDIPQDLIERAHREELNPADYKPLFTTLFTKSSPKVHHEN